MYGAFRGLNVFYFMSYEPFIAVHQPDTVAEPLLYLFYKIYACGSPETPICHVTNYDRTICLNFYEWS
jgi:hypothetical protein